MTDESKPYDCDENCSACGFDRIKDTYKYAYDMIGHSGSVNRIPATMMRCCLRCGRVWHRKPLNEPQEVK